MTRPVAPEDLFRFRFVVAADLSPDGSRVVFAQTRIAPGEEEDDEEVEHSDLHLLEVASGEVRRLTFNDSTNTAPAISPDGSSVAFMSTRTEKPQLWLLPLDGGEARKLTDLAQGVGGGPVWAPDGSKIAFTAGPQEEPRKPERPYRIDRTVWRFDEIGVIDDAVQDVYVLDITDDSPEPRRLTDDRYINSQPKWSTDGQSLVYVASHDPESHELMSRLRRVDLEGEVTDLTEPDGLVATHAPLSDGRVVYVLDFELDKVVGSRPSLYVLDPATGTRIRRGADIEGHIEGGIQGDNPGSRLGVGQLLLTDGDRDAVVRVQTGGEIALVKIALDGDESHTVVADGPRVCTPVAARGRKLLFGAFGFTEPGDLYLADLETGEEQRLTRLNDDVLSELALPTVVPLSFSSIDGAPVEGWFLQPAGSEAALPTLLNIHGGPHAGWGAHFNFDNLMFTGAGYGVLLVNHRASTGYGDAFATAIRGDWGNLDYADLMAGVDYAIEQGAGRPGAARRLRHLGRRQPDGLDHRAHRPLQGRLPGEPGLQLVLDVRHERRRSRLQRPRARRHAVRGRGRLPALLADHLRAPLHDARPCSCSTRATTAARPSRRSSSSPSCASTACRRRCCASRTRRTADPYDRADRPPTRPERSAARLDEPLRARRAGRDGATDRPPPRPPKGIESARCLYETAARRSAKPGSSAQSRSTSARSTAMTLPKVSARTRADRVPSSERSARSPTTEPGPSSRVPSGASTTIFPSSTR